MIGMSYVSSHFHTVFSAKERRPVITPLLRERLWPFLGGIARQNKMKVRRAIFVGLICGQMRSLGHAVHLKACSIQTRLGRHSAVPSGLVAMPTFPALKRRAILMMSLRDRERSPTGR